ncbi:MAG TPA: thioesterase family protein [Gemmataceae bacterium]|nr:thioesterase family protein [Gemmataceae bacterium]
MSNQTYEMSVRVQPQDVDGLNHVNNIVYLRWVQDVAIAHWRAIAPPEDQAELIWVVHRHEIDYLSPAFPNDELILHTRVGDAVGLRFERLTEILRAGDCKVLAKARTLWVPADPKSGRPKRVSAAVRDLFSAGQPDV